MVIKEKLRGGSIDTGTEFLSRQKLRPCVYDLSYNIISHSLIITLVKSNMIKYKSLIFIGILILLLFIPVSIEYRSGGIAGINEERYVNILMIPMKTKSFK